MRQQIAVSTTACHFSKEIGVADISCKSKIQPTADRLSIPREWQVSRRTTEIWAMRRQRSSEALDIFICA